jgi:transcriptional regulator with XRE-family HTH domain
MKRKTVHSPEHLELITLLFDLRRRADLTQVEAAAALGRPQTYVSAVEVGRRNLDLVQVREFCEIYGVTFPRFAVQFEQRLKALESHRRPPRLTRKAPSKPAAKAAAKKPPRARK